MPDQPPHSAQSTEPWHDSLVMRACRRQPVERTPVWLMRQAGRYLPEYRRVRETVSFKELCTTPELATEVMIATVERLEVDAAIIFSDLLPILEPMGMDLDYPVGGGPVIHNALLDPATFPGCRSLRISRRLSLCLRPCGKRGQALNPGLPLIGFAGAPFTLAGYCIEGARAVPGAARKPSCIATRVPGTP